MNNNSYSGREYLSRLINIGKNIDVISIGNKPEIDLAEENRCGGFWQPESQNNLESKFNFKNFSSLNCNKLINYLTENQFDLGIQGGTGIIKECIINQFKYGILNFHPGKLPEYRGCSAPEWQLIENQPVTSTCHYLSPGIDEGDILRIKILNVNMINYHLFRASIYPETAKFVESTIENIIYKPSILLESVEQDKAKAKYRKYIGEELIEELKLNYFEN